MISISPSASLVCAAALIGASGLFAQPAKKTSVPAQKTVLPAALVAALETHTDLVYARYGDREVKLDLYRPARRGKPLPAIVCIHGGGWFKGNRGMTRPLAQALADRGFVTVNIAYRLSGEAKFPAAIEDAKAAVRWLRAHATTFGVDPTAIGATGLSAGGHLAALLATSAGVPEIEGAGGHPSGSSPVQACIAMADDLEDQVCAQLVQGQVTELNHEQLRAEILLELGFEPMGRLRSDEVVEGVDGGCEEHGVAALTGFVAEDDAEVCLPEAATSDQDGVGFLFDEAQAKEVFHLQFVDFGRPVPAEAVEGFDDGEVGCVHAPLERTLLATLVFAFEEALQILGVRPAFFGGLLGGRLVVVLEIREMQVVDVGGDGIHGWRGS